MLSVVVGCVLEHFGVVLGYQVGVYVEVVGRVEPCKDFFGLWSEKQLVGSEVDELGNVELAAVVEEVVVTSGGNEFE